MRVVWGLILAGGLVLIGLQVAETRQDTAPGGGALTVAPMEDGTGFPPPDPPKPKAR